MIALATTTDQRHELAQELTYILDGLHSDQIVAMCADLNFPMTLPLLGADELDALATAWGLHALARLLLRHAPSPRTGVEILLSEFDALNNDLPPNAHSEVYTVINAGAGLQATK